jgi:D-glycero-alpha-D-manno-heptose 1-phosphate guanylyltransferase
MTIREAVILAGGFGNRLKTVVPDRPKPMADINGRPFLEYLLDFLISQGIYRVILSVGYQHEKIREHFGHHYQNIELSYAVEERPLGTGGGLLNALLQVTADRVFILNGDTFFRISLAELESEFTGNQADLVMALHSVQNRSRYGTVVMDGQGRILKFSEKINRSGSTLINGGIYLMNRTIFSGIDLPETFSMEIDFLEKYPDRLRFFGKVFQSDFLDIGIPETYQQAQYFFGHPENEK